MMEYEYQIIWLHSIIRQNDTAELDKMLRLLGDAGQRVVGVHDEFIVLIREKEEHPK